MTSSLPFVRPARLCPHVQCQPKGGVLADDSFHRRGQQPDRQTHFWPLHSCTWLQWGVIDCLLDFTLVMLCLSMSFFFAHAMMALSRKIAFSFAGNMLRYVPLQVLQSSFVNTPSPRRVSWALKSAWSRFYPLRLKVFALNIG